MFLNDDRKNVIIGIKDNLKNNFLFFFFSFVKSLPVLFISGIVGWSYYAYVVALVLAAMKDSVAEQVRNEWICLVIESKSDKCSHLSVQKNELKRSRKASVFLYVRSIYA